MTDTSSPNSSKNISSYAALLSVTHPFIPSQEGKQPRHLSLITNKNAAPKTSPHNILITNKKIAFQTSPLGEGSGVCHACAQLLNSKQSLEADRYHFSSNLDKCSSSPNSSNMLLETVSRNTSTQTAPLTITHPFNPLSRGEIPHTTHSLSTKKQHPNLSSGEGPEVCHACA